MEREKSIVMKSLTEALRIKDYLAGHGIRAQLVRTPGSTKQGGCSYSLYIPVGFDRALSLIRSGGAP